MATKLSTTKVEHTVISLSELFKKKIVPQIYAAEILSQLKNLDPDGMSSEVFYVSPSRLGSFICDDKVEAKLQEIDESFGDSIIYIDLHS